MKKKLFRPIIELLIRLLSFISSKLTQKRRLSLAYLLADFARAVSRKRREITLDNLNRAFPDKTHDWYRDILKGSFRSLGITYLELLAQRYFSEADVKKLIRIDNIDLDLVIEKHRQGKGIIFLSGHYGNWELMAFAVGVYLKIPLLIIVRRQKYGDTLTNESRTKAGNTIVDRAQAARKVIGTLKSGGVVALLADQSPTNDKDIYVEFFGRSALTYSSPAELALRFDVPVFLGFATRTEDGTYHVEVSELKHDDLRYDEQGIYELTHRYIRKLEEVIRRHPEQWAWQHRRWKHTQEEADVAEKLD